MEWLMNRILLFLFLAMSVYSYGFTQEQPGATSQHIIESKTFKGKVDSIILPDSVRGTRHEIVVIDNRGEKMNFSLTSGIGVYGPDWEVLSLKKIKSGDQVVVEYTTARKDGINRAMSIIVN
jgi:hypothetical protein